MIPFKPFADRILIEEDVEDEMTESGLYIPTIRGQTKMCKGTVLAVGPGELLGVGGRAEMQAKEGDRVIYLDLSSHDIKVGDKVLKILRDRDIIGKDSNDEEGNR